MDDAEEYVVRGRREESRDTVSLILTQRNGQVPSFVPGQFITVYFPELNTPEGKSYSISTPPSKDMFEITVKAIGEFSKRLCAMTPGDVIKGSRPYGFFFSEQKDTSLVMLAAGIGITPFRSIIAQTRAESPSRRLSLFHSVRTSNELLFRSEFEGKKDLSVQYFLTRDPSPDLPSIPRRMEATDIISNCEPEGSEFLICGSISFVRDLWRGLKENGVREEKIYTEAFFSH